MHLLTWSQTFFLGRELGPVFPITIPADTAVEKTRGMTSVRKADFVLTARVDGAKNTFKVWIDPMKGLVLVLSGKAGYEQAGLFWTADPDKVASVLRIKGYSPCAA